MLLAAAVLLTVGAIAFTLVVRDRDLPEPDARTGYEHLEERRVRIYEGLRDLQFEFRVGKLSEADYQRTKATLQTELASVMAQIDAAKSGAPSAAKAVASGQAKPVKAAGTVCPHCQANFASPLKFCGECGKPMTA
jgi:hypothetical protein